MPLTIVTSPRFADHLTPPGHPERVERFDVMQVVVNEFRAAGAGVIEPRPATTTELQRIHEAEYIGLVDETSGRAVALDGDTFTSPDTADVARLAAGAAVVAVEQVLAHAAGPARAIAVVRPPGHHAERDRAMGFCFFNNIAVAAAHARAAGLSRVAVVDFDVHHGNGTQFSFYSDPSVLFISSHQFPYYPGTGAAGEVGAAHGEGFTINLPLAAGATDGDYDQAYSAIVIPALRQFRPELILLSAGFDAHEDDPLGGMQLTAACFGRLTAAIAAVADECCGGRMVAVTEGGYDLPALASSLRSTMSALDGEAAGGIEASRPGTGRGDAVISEARTRLGRWWTL